MENKEVILSVKDLNVKFSLRGKVMPVLAILCSAFMVFAAIYSHKWDVAWYLGLFVVIEIIGACFKGGKEKTVSDR